VNWRSWRFAVHAVLAAKKPQKRARSAAARPLLIPGMARVAWFTLVFGVAVAAGGCSELYCQSGSKYGTQCYSTNEVEWQETMVREPPPPEKSTQPSPGCALLTKEGVHVMSQNPNVTSKPPAYLMSDACVSHRQPVEGALH
jgi:hypothetical protein